MLYEQTQSRSNIYDSIGEDANLVTDSKGKSDLLNKFFLLQVS